MQPEHHRQLLTGGSLQIAARLAGIASAALTAPLLARHFGPVSFGELTLAATIAFFIATASDLGMPLLAMRDLPSAADRQSWLSSYWGTRLITLVGVTSLAVAAEMWIGVGTPVLVATLAVPLVTLTGAIGALLTSDLRLVAVAGIEVAGRIGALFAAVITLAFHLDVAGYFGLMLIMAALSVVAAVTVARRTNVLARPDWRSRSLLLPAAALALIPLMGAAYARTDVLLLAWLTNDSVVGHYGIVWRVLEVLVAVLGVVGAVAIPLLSTIERRVRLDVASRLLAALSAVSMTTAVVVGVLAEQVVRLVGGEGFLVGAEGDATVTALRWTMGAFALMGFNSVLGAILVSEHLHRILVRHFVISIGANVLLGLALIPSMSLVGAAIASFVSEGVALVHAYLSVRNRVARLRGRPGQSLSLAAIALGATLLIRTQPPVTAILVGPFLVAVLLFGARIPHQIRETLQLLTPGSAITKGEGT